MKSLVAGAFGVGSAVMRHRRASFVFSVNADALVITRKPFSISSCRARAVRPRESPISSPSRTE